jgi:hypothetical protein
VEDVCLPQVETQKDLGIIIDKNLSFGEQITRVLQKSSLSVARIRRNFWFHDVTSQIKLFKTFVLPLLCYGSTIWSPFLKGEQINVESVQRSFTRLLEVDVNVHYLDRLVKFHLKPIFVLHRGRDLVLLYQALNDNSTRFSLNFQPLIPLESENRRSNRLNHSNTIQYSSISIPTKFWLNRAIPMWNSLSPNTTNCNTVARFKHNLNTYEFKILNEKFHVDFYTYFG